MLTLLFIAGALNLNAFSAPVTIPIDALEPLPPLSILGRDVPIPECINLTRDRAMHEIILSCLATIFACTWVSLHPNVPDPRNSWWQNFMMRMRTMLLALIGPEFIMIWAFRQLMAAREHKDAYNKKRGSPPTANASLAKQGPRSIWRRIMYRVKGDRGPWTLTHGFLLEMHGLVVFRDGQPDKDLPSIDQHNDPNAYSQAQTLKKLGRHGIVLHPCQLSNNRFDMSEDEINDKSKNDSFSKFFAVMQTSWFIIQCAARWAQRLYVTELEIVTLAFAILNIITYILWWNKPQDMGFAIPILDNYRDNVDDENNTEGTSFSEHESFLSNEKNIDDTSTLGVPPASTRSCAILRLVRDIDPSSAYGIMIGDDLGFGTSEVKAAFYSSTYGTATSEGGSAVGFAVGFIGLLFGGVHLLPVLLSVISSTREQYLWIASIICVLVEPVLVCLVGPVLNPDDLHLVFAIPHTIGLLLYVIARLTLIVLGFTSLRSLPSNAFVNVEWSTFLPHI